MNYSTMPCIFILSAVSYLKTEVILFHVRGSAALQYGKTSLHIHQSSILLTAVHLMVIPYVFTYVFIYVLFI